MALLEEEIASLSLDEQLDEESNEEDESSPPPKTRKVDPNFLPNDVVIIIEDEHLYVNKGLLESASPVFESWLKKEWQNDECSDTTKRELKFPGKTYDEMVTFLKCLLPVFPDKVTEETLNVVLPLADEYQAKDLINQCVEFIRQRMESVQGTDIYIPPSSIMTYFLLIDKFGLHTVKDAVVRVASYMKCKELEAAPGYESIGLKLQHEISNARANLLSSLFVSNVTEAKEKIYILGIPYSPNYLSEWKEHVKRLVIAELSSPSSKERLPTLSHRAKYRISPRISSSFACLDICDKFGFSESYSKTLERIRSQGITKDDFKTIWYGHYSKDIVSMKRHMLRMCNCAITA